MEDLKVSAIKSAFSSLSSDQKHYLLLQLMNMADINSIIDAEYEVDHVKHKFIIWITSFWASTKPEWLYIKQSYIDKCYEIYQLLEKESIGECRTSATEIGDFAVWKIGVQPNYYPFDDLKQKEKMFKKKVFNDVKPYLFVIYCIREIHGRNIIIEIKLTDLFENLYECKHHRGDEDSITKMILMVLGYIPVDHNSFNLEGFGWEDFINELSVSKFGHILYNSYKLLVTFG